MQRSNSQYLSFSAQTFDDRLGRRRVAQELSNFILTLPKDQGISIAINGAWGSGKTTLLRLVANEFNQQPHSLRPTIVWLNPWQMCTGAVEPGSLFFQTVIAKLSQEGSKVPANKLREFAMSISKLNSELSWLEGLSGLLFKTETDPTELRRRAARSLQKRRQRLILMIDDVDRLSPNDCLDILRVAHVISDLPNVGTLFALDLNATAMLLNTAMSAPMENGRFEDTLGFQFLDKVINVPIDVPPPDSVLSSSFDWNAIQSVIDRAAPSVWDPAEFKERFYASFKRVVNTPRNVVRFSNTAALTLKMVATEVHTGDFLILEMLRMFKPSVYQVIRDNEDMFAGPAVLDDNSVVRKFFPPQPLVSELEQFHSGWQEIIQSSPDAREIQEVLFAMFPRLETTFDRSSNAVVSEREMRICSPASFPKYFILGVPSNAVSAAVLQEIADASCETSELSSIMGQLLTERLPCEKSKLSEVLADISGHRMRSSSTQSSSLIRYFLEFGDNFNNHADTSERVGYPRGYRNLERAAHAVLALLRNLTVEERVEVLTDATDFESEVTALTIYVLALVHGFPSGPVPIGSPNLISTPALNRIVHSFADKLLAKNSFWKYKELNPVMKLLLWSKGSSTVCECIEKECGDSEHARTILINFKESGGTFKDFFDKRQAMTLLNCLSVLESDEATEHAIMELKEIG